MARTTIDFGIDLGTTNSEIAVLVGTQTEIIKNNESVEYTPSAVWVDRSGKLITGRRAKERSFFEPKNACTEFKRDMGTDKPFIFAASGKAMRPEELSAEVLKSLKQDVFQRTHEDIRSAVITVPADFDAPQIDATKRAAALAGLYNCPLLQEPIAAALAYGYQSKADRVFWLVYDFGGGTFDAALIQLRDGLFRVITHKGDNILGGKDLDWRIVEELMAPQFLEAHPLENFTRDNPQWQDAFAKMKIKAETMKIQLSVAEKTSEFIDGLIRDQNLDFEFELFQKDIARLAEPLIFRSIRICKEVLKDAKLDAKDIEKMILVGGPTLAPYLRDKLEDSKIGLGIPLEFSIDPLTVVSRGAAIFAGTQLLENVNGDPPPSGEFHLEMNYQPIGSDSEPIIGGKVTSAEVKDFSGYTIAITAVNYNSGRISLSANGAFSTSVLAEPEVKNTYTLELFGPSGTMERINPNTFTYIIGNVATDPPLPHSIGVALINNEVGWFLIKGQPLPARKLMILHNAFEVKKGEDKDSILVPVIEGSDERADLNRKIGQLKIAGSAVKRDLPAGSDLEVTMSIDRSRVITTIAYIPFLNQEFSEVLDYQSIQPDESDLVKDLDLQKKRITVLREQTRQVDEPEALLKLDQIANEDQVGMVENSMRGHQTREAEKHLLDLKRELAHIEEQLAWPALVKEAEVEIALTQKTVDEHGDAAAKQKVKGLERDVRQGIKAHEVALLRRKIGEMGALRFQIVSEKPEWWIGYFYYLAEDEKGSFINQARAQQLINEGNRAIQGNNIDTVKRVVVQLIQLLPPQKREEVEKNGPPYDTSTTR